MKINISLKLIATLRQKLPIGTEGNSCDLIVSDKGTVFELMNKFDIFEDNINVVLVNGHVPFKNQKLKEGDEVCAFPAIAGG